MGITVRVSAPADRRFFEELPDERLASAVRDGDDAAFEVLFRRHQPAVLAFCRHMLGRADEAQDAAQQTFLSAYRVLRAGERLDTVRPWLFKVARNRCVSMLRARREHHGADECDEPVTDGLAAEVQQRADLRALLRDLAELPADQREALLLAEVADFSHAEIAAVIGVRRKKVKALVFQARAALVAAKDARDTPCTAVREELATARGAALRRTQLRRHLHACAGCREFRDRLREQHRALGLLLPVAPSALRDAPWIGAIEASAGTGAAAAGSKAIAAKLAVTAVLAGGVAAGGPAVVIPQTSDPAPRTVAAAPAGSSAATTPAIGAGSTAAGAGVANQSGPWSGVPNAPGSAEHRGDRGPAGRNDGAAGGLGKNDPGTKGHGGKRDGRGSRARGPNGHQPTGHGAKEHGTRGRQPRAHSRATGHGSKRPGPNGHGATRRAAAPDVATRTGRQGRNPGAARAPVERAAREPRTSNASPAAKSPTVKPKDGAPKTMPKTPPAPVGAPSTTAAGAADSKPSKAAASR